MKRGLSLATIGFLVLLLAATSYAANTRKGKKTYDQLCRSCHISGAHGGRIAPSNKTKAEWKNFIETNLHVARPEIIEGMSKEEHENLILFLQDFASDSGGAQSCG
ncbi:MAG TPA: cytochrome c [Malonomonas sp.]